MSALTRRPQAEAPMRDHDPGAGAASYGDRDSAVQPEPRTSSDGTQPPW